MVERGGEEKICQALRRAQGRNVQASGLGLYPQLPATTRTRSAPARKRMAGRRCGICKINRAVGR
jgi:hypothetical protein